MKRGFGSDNHSGVSPEVLQAIANANTDHALAYGDDEWCAHTEALFRDTFGSQAKVYFVFNGTGANVLSIDAMCRSHEAVVCAETAHINVDECGAPQRVVGCRLLTVDTLDGKLTPQLVRTRLHGFGFEHHSQPKAISISQPTELGTLYTLDEIRALADLAHSYNMYLHMDGARLANAAVALNCTFKEMTSDLGVDCLSFGGTKNGLLMGESCVLLNPKLDVDMKYRRKQMTQLCSKMRFMAAQFEAYLTPSSSSHTPSPTATVGTSPSLGEELLPHQKLSNSTSKLEGVAAQRADGGVCLPLWYRNAAHSNAMAQMLYKELQELSSCHSLSLPATPCHSLKIMYPVQVNSVFVQLPADVWHALQKEYFFYDWDEAANIVRWMCSFDTIEEDIHAFVAALRKLLKENS